ncbi:TetR-like C-terminal domain-containing protein [Bailinhaonella thermotolerans]|uniref:TetR family transcriptional regulator n=1 Tax=Bailinhaonella thermotolerans TaxID=1070861 RepID=A0A3A4BC43_9ACTN|nr:TetR-like C-terminal domain-containing protein [Bailinhaonella thermotolerans]RJL35666.1 TetR family transcriptional regulator [Bailinhaonella thermotolerans]
MTPQVHRAGNAPPTGRRRGTALEQAIFEAVVQQLETVGYAGLTMEGVAAAAQTGKAALYRRWPGKAELVVDTLDRLLPSPEDLPDRGNVRDELIELLRQKAAVLNSRVGRAVQSLLAETERDLPFVRLVQERVFEPRLNVFRVILERGGRRGEIRPEPISPLVADVGPAMLVQRFLGDSSPIPDDFLVAIVDELILPLIKR